jgi:hypothetical protein
MRPIVADWRSGDHSGGTGSETGEEHYGRFGGLGVGSTKEADAQPRRLELDAAVVLRTAKFRPYLTLRKPPR